MKTVVSRFFTADRISSGVTCITGQAGENCYLIEGEERALLIDGLTGAGSLRAFVREITNKPVMMAATHGHPDHIGAAPEYGEVFIHPDDIAMLYYEKMNSDDERLRFIRLRNADTQVTAQDIVPLHAIKTWPLYEGDVFDLGGVQIEAVHVPGHTRGTLVFLDRSARVVYSGDACNNNTLLCLPGSASVIEYLEALKHFGAYSDAFDVMYGGHGKNAIPASIIEDGVAMCRRILAGEDDAVPVMTMLGEQAYLGSARGEKYMPACGGLCNIMYRRDALYPASRPHIAGQPVL